MAAKAYNLLSGKVTTDPHHMTKIAIIVSWDEKSLLPVVLICLFITTWFQE